MSRPPSFVVSDDPGAAAAAAFAGWTVLTRDLPDEPFDLSAERLVWAATVSAPDDATRVLLAASRGAPTVVAVDLDAAASARFLDDLRRAAEVRAVTTHRSALQLRIDHAQLLAAVAQGCSLGEAAARVCISRRTAARRPAEARTALDAPTTVEAIRVARELGLLPV